MCALADPVDDFVHSLLLLFVLVLVVVVVVATTLIACAVFEFLRVAFLLSRDLPRVCQVHSSLGKVDSLRSCHMHPTSPSSRVIGLAACTWVYMRFEVSTPQSLRTL